MQKIVYNFEGAAVLITGGASGLGLATAQRLLLSNANVVIADYDERGEQVAIDLNNKTKSDNVKCMFIKTDVTQENDIKKAVELIINNFGTIHGLVCSAGIGGSNNTIANETLANWNKVNAVDYTGVMLCNRYTIEQMLRQKTGGAIVNLASMFGLVAVPSNIAYSGAKGGVVNITRAAGTAYADKGIRVNCVCPGVIDTPLVPEDQKSFYANLHPMKRIGKPEEVASLITFLLSDDAKFITGTSISIDGGYVAV